MRSLVTLDLSRLKPVLSEDALKESRSSASTICSIEKIRPVPIKMDAARALLSEDGSPSYAAEEYRIVRTKLIHMLSRPFRLAVTSASIGDGKTLSAINLSVSLAMMGEGRTLLIDADLRRRDVHVRLGIGNELGLSDVLSGRCQLQDAIVQADQMPHLYVLPAGEPDSNIAELLHSPRWKTVGDLIASEFAYTVVDCPPADLFADYDLIAEICDSAVLVVRPDHTDRSLLASALKKIAPKLAGVLLNATKESILDHKRNRRYHQYYRSKYAEEPK